MTNERLFLPNTRHRKKRIYQVFWIAQTAMFVGLLHPIYLGTWSNFYALVSFILIMFSALWFLKRNNLDIAANIISCTITLLILFFAWFNQGARDEITLVFPALITFAVLTGTKRMLFVMAILIVVNIVLMGLANELSIHEHDLGDNGLIPSILIAGIFYVVYYSINQLGTDLKRANDELYQYQLDLEDTVNKRTEELALSLAQLKETQKDLVESEKLASLGRIVAGVAHEINTPVGVSTTASSVIADSTISMREKLNNNEISKRQFIEYLDTVHKSSLLISNNLK